MNRFAYCFAVIAIVCATPSLAQDSPQATAEEAAAAAQAAYGPPDPKAKAECPRPKNPGEIVVCGEQDDPAKYRVPSSADLDPKNAKDGIPRAPDLYNLPQPAMVGVGVSAKGCFIPPCPSPMPLLIDLKSIPEAPPGSDADRVAKGLAPRGDSVPPPAPATPALEPAVRPPESASPAEEPSGLASPRADAAPAPRSARRLRA